MFFMRTPAGTECSFFYGNYYRGRKQEECRLIGDAPPPNHWTPDLCRSCPVPAIQRANACPHLVLQGEIQKTLLGLKRTVKVTAYCTKSETSVPKPEVGCGICHPIPPVFTDNAK